MPHAPRRLHARMQLPLRLIGILLLGACSRAARAPEPPVAPMADGTLTLLSFNLRYDNPDDGINAWPNRRDRVAAAIRFYGAEVVGVQEALASMLTDLDMRLPHFRRVGVGRTDGKALGEFSAILYDTTRVTLLESGTFWLSPTPELVGSRGWDAALERTATWARFRDRRTNCTWVHLNTHFDHVGDTARIESAHLIRGRLATLAGTAPLTMTGDFNATPAHPAYQALTTGAAPGESRPLRDALVASDTPHYGPTSTWNGFTEIKPAQRIDFIFVSEGVRVRRHAILTDRWDGRFLSDHLPVLATVEPCGG